MSKHEEYLFIRLGAKCTKSEGPEYFLQSLPRLTWTHSSILVWYVVYRFLCKRVIPTRLP